MSESSPPTTPNVNRGIAWSGVAQAVISISDMVSIAITLALFVNETHYGIAGMALWLFPILDTVTDLGVASAIIQKDDHTETKISTVFWVNCMIAAVMALGLIGLAPVYAGLVGQPIVGGLLMAYAAKLLVQNAYTIPLALMRKQMRFDEVAKLRMIAHIAESIARPALAAAGAQIWCFALAPLVRTAVFAVLVQLRNPFLPKWVFRYAEIRDYLAFGLRSGATQLLYQTYVNLDYPIVGMAFGPAALGAYRLAYEIILEPVRSITNVVSDIALPTFARIKHHPVLRIQQFIAFTRLNLIAVLPFLVILFLIIPDAVMLFGKAQSAQSLQLTASCVRILCLVGILRALGFVGPPLLDGLGFPGLSLRYMAFAALAMPLCFINGAYYLGENYNAASVAIAWTIGYPLAFAILMRLVLRQLPLSLKAYLRAAAGPIACSALGMATGLVALYFLADVSRGARVVGVCISSVLPMLLAFRYGLRLSVRSIKQAM